MNTFLSSAQEAQVEQFRLFAREVLAPVANKLENHESCLKEFLQQLAQKNFLGLNVPKEYGGQDGKLLDFVLFAEAVGQFDAGLGLTLASQAAFVETLKKYGSAQQKSRYLPLLARGEAFGTIAFSEENAGTDYQNVQAVVDNNVLSGEKTWVVTGDFANLFLVLGKENGQLCLLLVDRPAEASFKLQRERRLMGLRSAYVNDVQFKGVQVNGDNRLSGSAEEVALYAMDVSKVVLAASALGLLEESTELAVNHARERQQFGTSIGQFQGVQWKLADMFVETCGSRLLVYRAAASHDEAPEEFRRNAAMCKWFSTRAARVHTGEALQIMGAHGLEDDGIIAHGYDDAKAMEIAQGTSEFQKMLLVKELNI